MTTWALPVVGLVVGGVVGYLWAASRLKTQQIETAGKTKAAERHRSEVQFPQCRRSSSRIRS